MANKAFLKYIEKGDTKNILRQLKAGIVVRKNYSKV